jgi:TolA-binding protein
MMGMATTRFLSLAAALACLLCDLPAQAPAGAAGETADEVQRAGITAYNAGKYAEAVTAFQKFESDFGESPQGKITFATLRYPLAMSLLHIQKFDDALAMIDACLAATPAPSSMQRDDLVFYKAVCQMQGDDQKAARITLEQFVKEFPKSRQTSEAMLLHATSFLLEAKYADAAKQLAAIRPLLDPVSRGRAAVLQLYALIEEAKLDDALALVVDEFPRMNGMLQVAAFHTLALQLGSEFLEKGDYRKAIAALQRVWTQDRLLKHQEQRLSGLEDALAAAEAQPRSDPYRKFQLKQMIGKVRREVDNLNKIQNFDSALRLRLATAYQGMERYREAALILEEMLKTMPPDPVVESASVGLVQSWSAIERWPKAIESADTFATKFPKSKQLATVMYLKGIAQQRLDDNAGAIATFEGIRKDFPKSDFAARSMFMVGFTELLADRNKEAIKTFESFAKAHPKSDLADAAAYWLGMAYSLDKQFPKSRDLLDDYLAKYKDGGFRGLAVFRKAYNAQSLRDFKTSTRELRAYLKDYPGHESNNEALVLLGDALMDQGKVEEGIAAFKRIPPDDTRFFEEGWFKIGKAYKLLERPDTMRTHFEQFVKEHPRSPRVAEAIYWIGWTWQKANESDKAREAYWSAISDYGDDASIRSVDDLFPALQKLYTCENEQSKYVARLRDLRETADGEGKKTLAMRALWAQALVSKKTDPERALLLDAASRADVTTTSPLLLADFAQALEQAGKDEDAEKMWRDLVKWNPRAVQKADALAALGLIEARRGNEKAALDYFDRFEKETLGSPIFGRVMLAKAALLLERGDPDAARKTYEVLLAGSSSTGAEKAEALYRIGDLYMKEGSYALAIPYFQRIYIMHSRWSDWTAKAYLGSGEAFEQLEDTAAARKTYEEMSKLEELKGFPETNKARARLQALGGPA